MSNSSIWPIDRILSGATTPGLNRLGSDGNEGVLRIPQSSSITGVSPSDCLVWYPGHSSGEFYSSAVMQPQPTGLKWPIVNRIIRIRLQYLKPFNYMQKNDLRLV